MKNDEISRRDWLKASVMGTYCLGAGTAFSLIENMGAAPNVSPEAYDLRQEPEIREQDKAKPLILDRPNYVENVFMAVGFASRCWKNEEFDMDNAIRIANELCALVRLHKEGKIP